MLKNYKENLEKSRFFYTVKIKKPCNRFKIDLVTLQLCEFNLKKQ